MVSCIHMKIWKVECGMEPIVSIKMEMLYETVFMVMIIIVMIKIQLQQGVIIMEHMWQELSVRNLILLA